MAQVAPPRADWADDLNDTEVTELPPPETIINPDGTKTVIEYKLNEAGQRVKITRKIRSVVKRVQLDPAVAERRSWKKFGLEKGRADGPQSDTTSIAENIPLNFTTNYKSRMQEERTKGDSNSSEQKSIKEQLKDKKVKCRICQGEHFTARCPYKGTMAPVDEDATPAADPMADDEGAGAGKGAGLGAGGSSYVPPHLRRGAGGASSTGEKMGGKYERDDLATLRVTNLSEMAEEQELRQLFERFGRVTRVFLAKDRDTGMAKGFAFVSFMDRADAARACDKLNGHGYKHLILNVEFAKRGT